MKIVLRKQPFFIVWGISMNSYGYNNHNKLLISKFIVLIADYISIVLGTLAAYHLRLNLPFLPVSPHFKVDEIYVYGVIPLVFLAILLLNNTYSVYLLIGIL